MDITRGSRRARHVAANASANAHAVVAASEEDVDDGRRQEQRPRQRDFAARAITTPGTTTVAHAAQTPDLQYESNPGSRRRAEAPPPVVRRQQATPSYSHRTPEQLGGQRSQGGLQTGLAGPAPHPFRLHRTAHYAGPRLSMPYDSDESSSEPDLSVLAMARGRHPMTDQIRNMNNNMAYDDEVLSQEQYEAEDTSLEEQADEESSEEEPEEAVSLVDPAALGLKEISNLGRFTVSSHKPGNGVEELRSDDLKLYWQSDGPQPHKLTVYFVKRVGIRDIRFFVDYSEDESYTPTKIIFKSGTSENNLIEFATMAMESPVGWQQVPIAGAGGDPDGNTLVSYVLQMQILENHQNGKDTHLRGIKIYAFDADAAQGAGRDTAAAEEEGAASAFGAADKLGDIVRDFAAARLEGGEAGFSIPDFMREPEIR
ncbi:anaphase-promoting complex apc10 domain protein [Metarhizium robertsii]|uniref:Anaphase-promoting complex, subunit 10/DOC domain protein n=2 Tax=Metarhizium robertsii TaxID=568076 RepID=E9ERJ5_METRA|nr:Anaphase-promoting complex, subunit 10/DOC domain protein [Metarhizium robertsii ARSEF 23]EFZ01362.1 Anaphase-promoting complex, subunit 10/DOC domain protein [Metarhizium robertsii ARSEF 23]EXU99535.1 anaphase-promoting complex apc10 domain protein [Metarhizium robertsii]